MMCLPPMPPLCLLRLEKRVRSEKGSKLGRETKLKVSIDAWESPPHGVDSEEANSG